MSIFRVGRDVFGRFQRSRRKNMEDKYHENEMNSKMIPIEIVEGMKSGRHGAFERREEQKADIAAQLATLGLDNNDEVRQFFEAYNLNAVLSKQSLELMDICSPHPRVARATEFARDIYELGDGFVALSSGEGEGFVLLRTLDGAVFDVGVEQFDALEAGELEPRWASFFDLIIWYLGERTYE